MDPAYVAMFATFGGCAILGAVIKRTWVVVALGSLVPIAFTASRLGKPGPGMWESLLFVSPFLIGGAVIYGFVALLGARFGRYLRRVFGGAGSEAG
jgi:hypothetical protein